MISIEELAYKSYKNDKLRNSKYHHNDNNIIAKSRLFTAELRPIKKLRRFYNGVVVSKSKHDGYRIINNPKESFENMILRGSSIKDLLYDDNFLTITDIVENEEY